MKFLVATTPSGHISFVFDVWGGRASDKNITLHSGFLEKINSGDLVLAARGFILNDYFTQKDA